MCSAVPMPAVPKVTTPGFVLASAIRSLTELTGTDGFTSSAVGMVP